MTKAESSLKTRRASYRHGMSAELVALLFLTLKGYRLVAWRYKTPVGEIDLIVRRRRSLRFVEVKGRRTRDAAAFAVHAKNQARVVRAAQSFLSSHPGYADCEMAFDVCLIAWYRFPHHIKNAFESRS